MYDTVSIISIFPGLLLMFDALVGGAILFNLRMFLTFALRHHDFPFTFHHWFHWGLESSTKPSI